MIRSTVRISVLILVFTAATFAQTRRALTVADYDRATKMLAPALNGLVIGGDVNPTWLPDGRFF
jgi:hypothetical protein